MEIKKKGGHRWGNGKGKQVRVHPLLTHLRKSLSNVNPVFPSTRGQMINGKQGLQRLKDLLVEQMPLMAGGGRTECLQRCQEGLAERDKFDDGHIKLFHVPVNQAVALLQQAWHEAEPCFRALQVQNRQRKGRNSFSFVSFGLCFRVLAEVDSEIHVG